MFLAVSQWDKLRFGKCCETYNKNQDGAKADMSVYLYFSKPDSRAILNQIEYDVITGTDSGWLVLCKLPIWIM